MPTFQTRARLRSGHGISEGLGGIAHIGIPPVFELASEEMVDPAEPVLECGH